MRNHKPHQTEHHTGQPNIKLNPLSVSIFVHFLKNTINILTIFSQYPLDIFSVTKLSTCPGRLFLIFPFQTDIHILHNSNISNRHMTIVNFFLSAIFTKWYINFRFLINTMLKRFPDKIANSSPFVNANRISYYKTEKIFQWP